MGLIRIRWIEKAESDFNRAYKMKNVQDALHLLGRWVGKPIMEEAVRRYDTKTGTPSETGKFKPYEVWDGVLWLNSFGNSPSLADEEILYTPLLQTIKKGETVSFGDYIVQHISPRSEGGLGSMSDQGGTIPAHIRIVKPRRL